MVALVALRAGGGGQTALDPKQRKRRLAATLRGG